MLLHVSFSWKLPDGTHGFGDGVFGANGAPRTSADLDRIKGGIAEFCEMPEAHIVIITWNEMAGSEEEEQMVSGDVEGMARA